MPEPQPPLGQSVPLVPPLYQSSVYTLPDLDALDRIMNAQAPGSSMRATAIPMPGSWRTSLPPWKGPTGR